jgi:hypothetical protein
MGWDGQERRACVARDNFCNQHISLVQDLAVIKTSTKNIENQITQSGSFRIGVVISLLTIAFSLVIQVTSFAYLYGQLSNQVSVNTDSINILEKNEVRTMRPSMS